MAEERKRVQAAEKKLKMVDVPLSEVKDDTRLKQHEKEILVQEVITRMYGKRINLYSYIAISLIRIGDIANSNERYRYIGLKVNSACHTHAPTLCLKKPH